MLKDGVEGKQLKLFGRRTLFILGYVAIVAFAVRYAVEPIPQLPDLAGLLRASGDTYSNSMLPKAAILGVIGAMAALVYAIIGAIVKKVFVKIGARIERCLGTQARIMSLCSLAGLLTGVLGYLCPMSLASGKEALIPMIFSRLPSDDPSFPNHLFPTPPDQSGWSLLWIVVAKTLSFSVASAGGMVGGPFFPVLFIGVVIGQLCALIPIDWSVHPTAITVPVVMVSMPSSVFPIPFTLVAIPLSYFHLGTDGCVPILVGIVTSYTLVVGSGLIKALARG